MALIWLGMIRLAIWFSACDDPSSLRWPRVSHNHSIAYLAEPATTEKGLG
jgi:hypothetical protein